MNLRDALIYQNPSLELQRAAASEIARLDALVKYQEGEIRVLKELLAQQMAERNTEEGDKPER